MNYGSLTVFIISVGLSAGFVFLIAKITLHKTKNPCLDYRLAKPAGYSLSNKVNKLIISVIYAYFWSVGLIFAPLLLAYQHHQSTAHFIWIGIFTVPSIISLYFTNRLIKRLFNYQAGLIGEQSVGHELSLLIKEGYAVFHDLVDENKKFNIDHIVVADSGVFVVETKVRRKLRKRKPDEPKPLIESELNQVTFIDGHKKYIDYSAMLQAKRNAETLAKMISEDLAISVQVTPIVAFVGWLIQRKSQGEVRVVSGRHTEFRNIFNNRPVLSPRDRLQIEKWLAKQCMIKE